MKLNSILVSCGVDLSLDRGMLSLLKDYYFDAKYPGDTFVTVTKLEAQDCMKFVDTVKSKVGGYLTSQGYCTVCGNKLGSSSCACCGMVECTSFSE